MPITYTGPTIHTQEGGSTITFDVDIGSAEDGRIVLVALHHDDSNAGTVSSSTLAGVSGTTLAEVVSAAGGELHNHVVAAVVPSGTGTQSVSITLSAGAFNIVAAAYVIRGAAWPASATGAIDGSSLALTAPANGAVFAVNGDYFGGVTGTMSAGATALTTTAQTVFYGSSTALFGDGTDLPSGDATITGSYGALVIAAAVFEPEAGGGTDALTADDLQSVSEVSQPVIGQTHGLNAGDIQAASSVTQPTMGQTHGLAADNLESASSVTTPVIGQTHVITADDVQAVSQVSQPVIGQVHSLAADDLQSVATVSTPTLAEVAAGVDALLAEDLDAASEVSSPALGQVHALSAASIEAASTVSRPAVFDGTVQVLPGKGGVRDVVDRRKEKWQRRKEAEQAAREALAAAFDGPQEAQQETEPETVAEKPKAAPVARRAAVPAFDATNLLRQVDALETRLIEQADDEEAAAFLLLLA